MTRSEIEEAARADAVVLIFAHKLVRPLLEVEQVARCADVSYGAIVAAVKRFRGRLAPKPSLSVVGGERRYHNRPKDLVVPDGQKWCGYHQACHDRGDFGPNKASRDGLQSYCRDASRAVGRDHYKKQGVG